MMTQAQAEKLTSAPPPELQTLLAGNPADIASETAAALGVGYRIGKFTMPPVTLGALPLLEAVESPIVDELAGERIGAADIMRAVYVLARGYDAAAGVMAMYRRKAALHNERERAAKDPALYAAYLEQVDKLERLWIEFDREAAEFWDREIGPTGTLTEAAEVVARAMKDAVSGLAAIPKGTEKKTGRGTLTPNGWRA